jgi:hypothetical protein
MRIAVLGTGSALTELSGALLASAPSGWGNSQWLSTSVAEPARADGSRFG